MMTDPIADLLTRIRNAVSIERGSIVAPSSRLKEGVADALKREGFIWDWRVIAGRPEDRRPEDAQVVGPQHRLPHNLLLIDLKYGPNGERVIRRIQRTSRPGRRVYRPAKELRPVLEGLGISVLSTSQGVLSDREARRRNVGGEVLCTIW